ncbi:MAG: two-component regulator propeller domain-containing protein [Prevotella sp.]
MKGIFCTISLLVLVLAKVFSQSALVERYNCSILNMSGGLPNNFVDDIYPDSNGFIWISTHGGGLVRYDGYAYQYFGVGNQGISLESNTCRNVYEDNFHRLWIAFEEGVEVLDLETLEPANLKCTTNVLSRKLKLLMGENCIRVYKDAYSGGIPFTYSGDIRSLNCC